MDVFSNLKTPTTKKPTPPHTTSCLEKNGKETKKPMESIKETQPNSQNVAQRICELKQANSG
jgi:hypothetical protein